MTVPGFRGVEVRAFGRRLCREFFDNAVTDTAAQLSYYFLFALFPFLFFLVTLLAYLPLQGAVDEMLLRLSAFVPPQAMRIVQQQLAALLHRPKPRLLTAGLLLAIWFASRGVDALRTALNRAYDVKESRPWWRVQLMAIALTMAVSILVLLSFAGILLGGEAGFWLADRIHSGGPFLVVWSWLRFPITALVVMLAVAVLYYFLPDVEQRFRYITPGSVTATVLWLAATWGFTRYVAHFGSYDVMYGSIGGVVVLLTWLYITGLVFAVGGEVNAVIEHLSPEGKVRGARAPGKAPAPPSERPSAMPVGAAKSVEAARRSRGGVRPLDGGERGA